MLFSQREQVIYLNRKQLHYFTCWHLNAKANTNRITIDSYIILIRITSKSYVKNIANCTLHFKPPCCFTHRPIWLLNFGYARALWISLLICIRRKENYFHVWLSLARNSCGRKRCWLWRKASYKFYYRHINVATWNWFASRNILWLWKRGLRFIYTIQYRLRTL